MPSRGDIVSRERLLQGLTAVCVFILYGMGFYDSDRLARAGEAKVRQKEVESSVEAPAMNRGDDPVPVWIDADPACGQGATRDVDDCWALLQAFGSPELKILGISTVFGNTDGPTAFTTAKSLVLRYFGSQVESGEVHFVHPGSSGAGGQQNSLGTEASSALVEALRHQKVTLIALGPLTNIAAFLKNNPRLIAGIQGIVAVAGKRSGHGWFYPGDSRWLHFHDFNFKADPAAFETVLHSKVPLTLMPFELATKLTISRRDLDRLIRLGGQTKWLAEISRDWMDFWENQLGKDGFHPFDTLAVGYVSMPFLFRCEKIPARIRWKRSLFVTRDELLVSHDFPAATTVTYCFDVDPRFKRELMDRLSGWNEP